MSEELTTIEVADEIKAVMEDENFIPSPEDIECYGKHQIKPSEILPCPFCGSEYLQFGDWGTHGAYDKVACGNECTDWIPVERWNSRPVEDSQAVRIAELEKMAEARKFANCLLEQERNELEAERDRMRKALVKLKECLEGYFGKTEKDFFEDCNEDSGELYFADVYNVAVNALKKARSEA